MLHRALQDFSLLPHEFYELEEGERNFIVASVLVAASEPKFF